MDEPDLKAGLKKEWELSKRKREERHSRQREQVHAKERQEGAGPFKELNKVCVSGAERG